MLWRLLRDGALALAAATAVAAVALAALTARVEGPSMSPTLRDGDLLLVDRLGPRLAPPARGDVVVIALNPSGVPGVKRVVAVPGDTVAIDGTHVDGPGGRPHPVVLLRPGGAGPWRQLDEPYLAGDWGRPEFCCDAGGRAGGPAARPLTVPAGEFFVLGDNRGVSIDSRTFGLVPRDRILGRVLTRYWPAGRAGGLGPEASLARSHTDLDGSTTGR
ncbi:MAG: signal peptidase I [Chloroflexi bacterium]|nr:MAG: signal peptidase I [Chloroflexota bacterium]